MKTPVLLLLCLMLLSFPAAVLGQSQTTAQLTNSDVIALVKSGIPDSVVLAKIKTSPTAFDTSPRALEALKAAGVSGPVMLAMVSAPAAGSTPAAAPAAGDAPAPVALMNSGRPVIEVLRFGVKHDVPWPYDPKQMQLQTIAELQRKDDKQFEVVSSASANQPNLYVLHGEVVAWHPGNKAMRMMVGLGSGRETAKIHYWLTGADGKKVFDSADTIRASFWSNAYSNSAGQLAQPFADKIALRLSQAEAFKGQ